MINTREGKSLRSELCSEAMKAAVGMSGRSRISSLLLLLVFSNTLLLLFFILFDSEQRKLQNQPPLLSSASANKRFGNSLDTKSKKMTSLEGIEAGLAQARDSIQRAIRSRSYYESADEDENEEIFVPKGYIYWNPRAFYQSHKEMLKRLKIWVYKEGEQPLVHDGPVNNKYAIEGQFIDEIENCKKHTSFFNLRASHPYEAHVFFLPFTVSKVIRYIYKPRRSKSEYDPQRLQQLVEDYISVVAHKYPYWNRSKGADHFLLSCHDWGPRISNGNPQLFKNFMRALRNANMSEGFQPSRDVSIPEVYLPGGKLGPPNMGRNPNNWPILAFSAGGAHGKIRKKLLKGWKDKDDEIQVHE